MRPLSTDGAVLISVLIDSNVFCYFTGQIPGGMVPMYPPGTTQAQILAGTVRPTHYAIGNQLYQIVQQRGQFMLQPVQQPNKPVANFNQVCSHLNFEKKRPTGLN